MSPPTSTSASPRHAVLTETLAALSQAAERLAATHAGIATLFPLTGNALESLPETDRERLDAYAIRYARCQDLLFPAMRALARAQLEPAADRGFLDLFALMQKQGVTGTLDDWERQRDLRNAIGHEYPETSAIADILNALRAGHWFSLILVAKYMKYIYNIVYANAAINDMLKLDNDQEIDLPLLQFRTARSSEEL